MKAKRYSVPGRCNKPASRYADSGYRVCEACHKLESAATQFTLEFGIGRCDRPIDGLGAAKLERDTAWREVAYASKRIENLNSILETLRAIAKHSLGNYPEQAAIVSLARKALCKYRGEA